MKSANNGNEFRRAAVPLTRIPSGIPGLDEMMEGGFPFPSVILVAGSAGTGKTTFGLKFLCEGAVNHEQGLYITTLSEPTQWMLRFASQLDFMRPEYFGEEIQYLDLGASMRDMTSARLMEVIEEKIAEVIPQRIVIDPVTVFGTMLKDDYRSFLFDITTRLKNWNATTVLTGEVSPGEMYPQEIAYAVDGIVLLLQSEEVGTRRKYLEIIKMRGTNHQSGKQSIDVTRAHGITVLKARF